MSETKGLYAQVQVDTTELQAQVAQAQATIANLLAWVGNCFAAARGAAEAEMVAANYKRNELAQAIEALEAEIRYVTMALWDLAKDDPLNPFRPTPQGSNAETRALQLAATLNAHPDIRDRRRAVHKAETQYAILCFDAEMARIGLQEARDNYNTTMQQSQIEERLLMILAG